MRSVILTVTIWALASARPETYREKEDFQYSRSSSDDGTKAGYYGAQRGNMGGNYERAHNMDSLAQHQMGSLVTQVDGELGSGADSKSGSIYTAGNSRGMFGSGHYDLSVLKGRNFAEGNSYGDSEGYSSALNSGYQGHTYSNKNARYNIRQSQSSSQNLGYQGAEQTGSHMDTNNQEVDNTQYSGLDQEYRNQGASNYKYHTQNSNQVRKQYEQSISNSDSGSDAQIRSMSTTPIKVYVRPGTKATIPITAHTYDASQLSSSHNENAINSDAEFLGNSRPVIMYTPTNKAKHYESSYSYKKEWEKHDTSPVVTPTENPFPKNSELFDTDGKLILHNSNQNTFDVNSVQGSRLSNAYTSGYRANSKSLASQESRYHTGYNAEGQNTATGTHSSASSFDRQIGNSGSANNLLEEIGTKPKSYHSSYSYHKSWERQGDPYVIKPASGDQNDLSSQRLTSASENYGQLSSHQHGSNYNYAQHAYSQSGADLDCDENGHIRLPRSYNSNDYQNVQEPTYFGQQQDNGWENQEDLGQQIQGKWENVEDLGQQSEYKWDQLQDLHQQDKQDLEVQSLNKWDNLQTVSQQEKDKTKELEDFGQQSQNKWDNLEAVSQLAENKQDGLQNLGQQSQNKWDNLETIDQHAVNNNEKLEDLGQQSQNTWDNLETIDQHTVNNNEKLEDLGQQSQNKWDNLETMDQHAVNNNEKLDLGQQIQNTFDNSEDMGQQTQNKWDYLEHYGQQTQYNRNFDTHSNQHTLSVLEQQSQNEKGITTENHDQEYTNIYIRQYPHQQDQEINKVKINQYQNILNTLENIRNRLQNQQNQYVWSSDDHHQLDQNITTIKEQTGLNNDELNTNFWDQFDQEKIDHQEGNIAQGNTEELNKNNNEDKFITNYSVPKIDFPKSIQEESPLNSLWDKVDQISGISLQSSISSTTKSYNEYWNQNYDKNLWDIEQSTDQKDLFDFDSTHLRNPVLKTENNENVNIITDSDHSKVSNHQSSHFNAGRGDIESEDSSVESSLDLGNHKTTNEVESLSLTKKDNISTYNEDQDENKNILRPTTEVYRNKFDSTTTPQAEINENNQIKINDFDLNKSLENIHQQNTKEEIDNFDQQNENIDTQTLLDFYQQTQMQDNVQEHKSLDNFDQNNEQQQSLDTFAEANGLQVQSENEEQQLQNAWQSGINMQQFDETKQFDETLTKKNVDEKNKALISPDFKKQDEMLMPIEIVTEKPSFWKSVGSKLSNAKDSVVSWFKSS